MPGDLPLGLLDPQVAGADDHVDGRHRLGPERERGDRLGTAHPVDRSRPGQVAGGQHHLVDLAVGARRRADHHLLHPGGVGGHHPHHDRAGVRSAASWDVDRGSLQRRLAEHHLMRAEAHCPVRSQARPGDLADVGDRQPQAFADVVRQRVTGALERPLGYLKRLRRLAPSIEPLRVLEHRRISAIANRGDDLGDALGYRLRGRHQSAKLPDELRRPARAQRDRLTPHQGAPAASRSPAP